MSVVVFTLALVVHLITVLLAAVAVFIVAAPLGVTLWMRIVGGGLLLAVAYFVQPFRRRKWNPIEVSRKDARELFALIDRVAKSIDAPAVERVVVTADFNAFYTRSRARGRVIGIGMSLWSVLGAQEKVALLGHELAHAVNGDLRNIKLVGAAFVTLGRWQQLLEPDLPRRRARSYEQMLVSFAERLLLPLLLLPFFLAVTASRQVLGVLANRDGQRREYYADELAAQAAGSEAAIRLTEMLLLDDFCSRTVIHSVKFFRQSDPFQVLADSVTTVPSSEWERRRRVARRRLNRIDVTHPPTQLRADLLADRPIREAMVVLDPDRASRIDNELALTKDPLVRRLRDALGVSAS